MDGSVDIVPQHADGPRSLRLAEAQEARRKPNLSVSLVDGYVRFVDEERLRAYAFLISISNPTDTSNSVTHFGLRVNYATTGGLRTSVVVSAAEVLASSSQGDAQGAVLQAPLKVDAHQTIAGWVPFRVKYDLIGEGLIEDYVIVATDTHGNKALRETVLVREMFHVEEKSTGQSGQG